MNVGVGKILVSTDAMDDFRFRDSVVFIIEHNENGATGFVVSKVFERPLNALVEFSSSPAFPLYDGGPVDKEHLFFMHRCHDLIPGGTMIFGDIYFGGDFKQAVMHINNGTLTENEIKIFVGYCGWDAGELEEEITTGSWTVEEPDAETVFAVTPQ